MGLNNFIENIPRRKSRLYLVHSNFLSLWPVKHNLIWWRSFSCVVVTYTLKFPPTQMCVFYLGTATCFGISRPSSGHQLNILKTG